MIELPPDAKIPVDMTADDAKKCLIKLQKVLKPGCQVFGTIDVEKNHCKEFSIRDRVPSGALRPRFDFEYVLKDMGKYNAMSWKDTTISYEEAVLFYALTFMIKPITVVETGMGLGLSTVHIAQALSDNEKGELFTIEQDSSLIQRGVSALNSFGFKEQVTILSQSSLRILSEWTRPVDLVFLDTPSRQAEFELLATKIKPNGLVVSRGILHVPNDGLWRKMEIPGMDILFIYQRVATATDTVKSSEDSKGEFSPEQAEWNPNPIMLVPPEATSKEEIESIRNEMMKACGVPPEMLTGGEPQSGAALKAAHIEAAAKQQHGVKRAVVEEIKPEAESPKRRPARKKNTK